MSSSLTHRLSITDAAATAAFPSSFFCTLRLFTPNWYLGRVTACSGCATTSYTRPYFFLFQRQHLPAVSGRCVCTCTHTHVGRVLGAFSFHLDYCLAFLYFATPRRRPRVGCGLWGQWNQLERCGAQADLHL